MTLVAVRAAEVDLESHDRVIARALGLPRALSAARAGALGERRARAQPRARPGAAPGGQLGASSRALGKSPAPALRGPAPE